MDSSHTLLVNSNMVMYRMVSPQTLPCGILSYGMRFVVDIGQSNARSVSWKWRGQHVGLPGFWVRLGLSRLFHVYHRGLYTGQEFVNYFFAGKWAVDGMIEANRCSQSILSTRSKQRHTLTDVRTVSRAGLHQGSEETTPASEPQVSESRLRRRHRRSPAPSLLISFRLQWRTPPTP